MRNNIPEEIKKSEERTEKRMVELNSTDKRKKRNRGKAARRGKNGIHQ